MDADVMNRLRADAAAAAEELRISLERQQRRRTGLGGGGEASADPTSNGGDDDDDASSSSSDSKSVGGRPLASVVMKGKPLEDGEDGEARIANSGGLPQTTTDPTTGSPVAATSGDADRHVELLHDQKQKAPPTPSEATPQALMMCDSDRESDGESPSGPHTGVGARGWIAIPPVESVAGDDEDEASLPGRAIPAGNSITHAGLVHSTMPGGVVVVKAANDEDCARPHRRHLRTRRRPLLPRLRV
eukprot:GHVU01102791.1.p1 GENE.GHVU01102791.1~~GHVU01102791.1.p1  ORF type:complete len:245 (+),score=34.57 GHVU01102791.1:1009-1743(+)